MGRLGGTGGPGRPVRPGDPLEVCEVVVAAGSGGGVARPRRVGVAPPRRFNPACRLGYRVRSHRRRARTCLPSPARRASRSEGRSHWTWQESRKSLCVSVAQPVGRGNRPRQRARCHEIVALKAICQANVDRRSRRKPGPGRNNALTGQGKSRLQSDRSHTAQPGARAAALGRTTARDEPLTARLSRWDIVPARHAERRGRPGRGARRAPPRSLRRRGRRARPRRRPSTPRRARPGRRRRADPGSARP